MKTPAKMTVARLQVLVMPNGEVLCHGTTVGWVAKLGHLLYDDTDKPLETLLEALKLTIAMHCPTDGVSCGPCTNHLRLIRKFQQP